MKKENKLIWTSIFTAVGASLCCITPVLALISGASGVASTFSWLDPLRPYLIGFTILVLGFAWYQKLIPIAIGTKKEIDCECETEDLPAGMAGKPKFIQSKTFLGLVTGFAILMMAFPYYSSVFYPKTEKEIVLVDQENIQTIKMDIKGMTCTGCEDHITYTVNQLEGILAINASYKQGNAEIEFDTSKTSIEDIEKAVNSTGYTVISIEQK